MSKKAVGMEMSPMENLIQVRLVRNADIKALVEAAKLYLEGKTEDEAFTYVPRADMEFKFIPPSSSVSDVSAVYLWANTFLLLGQKEKEALPDKKHLVPYLLTTLCSDLLDHNSRSGNYNSSECGYGVDEASGEVRMRLWKNIDYCSYHTIEVLITVSGFMVAVKGAWSGHQQDPGPVWHSEEDSYDAHIEYLDGRVRHSKLTGSKYLEAFKLWGIDIEKTAELSKSAESVAV